MREMLERNELEAEDLVSCIFTLTEDLDAEFPAVAARRMGLEPRAADVRARDAACPGALPRVIRVLIHCYADDDHEPQHVYLRRGAPRCALDLAGGAVGSIGDADRVRASASAASPSTRPPTATRSAGDVALLASNETPFPPLPEVVEAVDAARSAGVNRYPDPTNAALRRRSRDRYGVPASRIAIGNGSCDILLAAGEALLEPGAEIVYAWPSFCVYPHLAAASGARAIEVPLDDDHDHDLDAMRARDHRRDAARDRLQPEQPDLDRAPARGRSRPSSRDVPRHVGVILDEAYCEFNTLAGPRRVDRPARAAPEPRPAAHVLARSTGSAGCASATALCGSEDFRTAVDQVRQPFFCNAAAQAAAVEALNHQDEVAAPRRAQPRRADRARGRAARARHRARRVAGQLRLVRPAGRRRRGARRARARVVAGSPSAACSSAPAPRSAARARCASRSAPQAENERFLDALGALARDAALESLAIARPMLARLDVSQPCASSTAPQLG